MKFGIGQAVKRVEDKVLITGTGKFTDDIDVGEGLSAHFLRSAHAPDEFQLHARPRG